jgi:hypothetical protein
LPSSQFIFRLLSFVSLTFLKVSHICVGVLLEVLLDLHHNLLVFVQIRNVVNEILLRQQLLHVQQWPFPQILVITLLKSAPVLDYVVTPRFQQSQELNILAKGLQSIPILALIYCFDEVTTQIADIWIQIYSFASYGGLSAIDAAHL